MAFTGDASQIPISNIVQALFMNGQEGVLSISDGRHRRNIRVLKLGIRPLSAAPREPDLLRRALVKEKILTESEYQNAISTWTPESRQLAGDFLIRRRLITPAQVEGPIRKQLEEVLYETFSSRDVTYEFQANQAWADHEIFDPETLGAALIYSVSGILMECARREDDWQRIRGAIPSEHEIFAPVSRSLTQAKPGDLDVSEALYKAVRPLISGERTVARIIAETSYSAYEVSRLLFQLHAGGHIRRLDVNEKEQLVEKLRRLMKSRDAIGLYQSILAEDPDNIRVRTQLISVLEKAEVDRELLIEHYGALARLYERTESGKALYYIDRILQLDPDHLPSHEKQFLLLCAEGRKDAALASIRAIVRSAKSTGRYHQGANLLVNALTHFPDEPYLLQEIADMLLASGQNELAIGYLKSLTSIYERRGEIHKHRKTVQLIIKLDPTESSRLKFVEPELPMEPATLNHVLRTALVSLVCVSILTAVIFFGLTEVESRRHLVDAAAAIDAHIKSGHFSRARHTLAEYQRAYPLSTQKGKLTELVEQIEASEKEAEAKRLRLIERVDFGILSDLAKAEGLQKKGDYERSLQLLKERAAELSKLELPRENKTSYSKLQEHIASLEAYFEEARKLLDQALEAEKRGDIPKAHSISIALLASYPNSTGARSLLFPILIQTLPDTADVYVNNKKVAEKTPFVAKVPPHKPAAIQIEHRGFTSRSFLVEPEKTPELTVVLDKDQEWRCDTAGPIDAYPAVLGTDIFVANRNGRIFCLTHDGTKKWEFRVPDKADIAGGLGVWNNLVYAGCFDGNIYLLSATTGTLQSSPIAASRQNLAIKHVPSEPSSAGVVVVNCDGVVLSGISLATQQREWSQPLESQALGPPQALGKFVYVFTQSGALLKLDHNTGTKHPVIDLGGELNYHGVIADGKVFVADYRNNLRVIDLSSEKLLWSKQLGSTILAPPTVSMMHEAIVLPLEGNQLACFELRDGAERWRVTATSSVRADGLVFLNKLYVGSSSGEILRLDLVTGEPNWIFKTAGARQDPARAITARGVISKGKYFQGSEDGYLYCLTLD